MDKESRSGLRLSGEETISIEIDANETVMLQDANETVMLQEENATMMLDDDGKSKGYSRELYQMAEGEILAERYVIGDILGFGGFGITYSAWDKKLEMKVAIKEYYPSHLVNRIAGSRKVEVFSEKKRGEFEKGLQRFLGEAQNMAQFSGEKNIVNVFNYFQENGTAYLVMEYLDGLSLKEYTAKHGDKLPYAQVIDITMSLISALKTLHKKKIIHRDISPDNIYMCKDGTVKLIDFGAARFADESDELKTRSVILKPGFAPPEQYRSKGKQGPWTDIYALGATMYRTVTGIVPEESVNREVKDNLKAPRDYVSEIPKYFNNLLMKCLALQPQMRFQNVDDLEKKMKKKKTVSSVKGELFRRKLLRAVLITVFFAGIIAFGVREYKYISGMRNQANLQECSITVLVMAADGDEEGQTEEIFRSGIAEFEQTYPFVKIGVETVSEKDYETRINQLALENKLPTVFESDMLLSEYDALLADLSYTQDLLNPDDYLFGNQFTEDRNVTNKLATGFNTLVCYKNTQMLQEEKTQYAVHNDLKMFLEEKSAIYIGTLYDYATIQSALAGLYEVDFLSQRENAIDFVHTWSVNANANDAERNAGERLICYLMSEQAQDIMYIQNEEGLPLYKNTMDVYMSVNPELSGLSEEIGREASFKDITSDYLETIYQEEIQK